jgi:hypothetical protein
VQFEFRSNPARPLVDRTTQFDGITPWGRPERTCIFASELRWTFVADTESDVGYVLVRRHEAGARFGSPSAAIDARSISKSTADEQRRHPEKGYSSTDPERLPDEVLNEISLYWLTNTGCA